MSLLTRLAKLEEVAAERQAAEQAARLAEFNTWMADNFSPAERALWDRHLLNIPVDDAFFARLSLTRAEAEAIIAEYAPLFLDEEAALEAALARVPAELQERLQRAG